MTKSEAAVYRQIIRDGVSAGECKFMLVKASAMLKAFIWGLVFAVVGFIGITIPYTVPAPTEVSDGLSKLAEFTANLSGIVAFICVWFIPAAPLVYLIMFKHYIKLATLVSSKTNN